jgi:hypothetical protein
VKQTFVTVRLCIVRVALFSWLALIMSAGSAQAATVSYILDNVWLDITDPDYYYKPNEQLIASFDWTYNEGNFAQGSGVFTELSIPWFGHDENQYVDIAFDGNALVFSWAPNDWHDIGLDIEMKFNSAFYNNEGNPNFGTFNVETSDALKGGFTIEDPIAYNGDIISGSITPSFSVVPIPAAVWLFGSGLLGLLGVARRKKA